jgi:hypothetical protein
MDTEGEHYKYNEDYYRVGRLPKKYTDGWDLSVILPQKEEVKEETDEERQRRLLVRCRVSRID